jgi:hypothetical protein
MMSGKKPKKLPDEYFVIMDRMLEIESLYAKYVKSERDRSGYVSYERKAQLFMRARDEINEQQPSDNLVT